MKEIETWVDVKGYEGFYQISNLGRVRSLDRVIAVNDARCNQPRMVSRKGKTLKDYYDGTGRQMVILQRLGLCDTRSVHRLVAEHFITNPDSLPVVHHINHNHLDNRATNLEWCTQKQNIAYAIRAGRFEHIKKSSQSAH